MKITLYLSAKRREQQLREALIKGFQEHGETVIARHRKEFWADWKSNVSDLVVYVGVKSRKMWNVCIENNRRVLLIDKGYFGRADYFRASLGAYQPPYLEYMRYDTSRLHQLKVFIQPKKQNGNFVLYAGSSNKYCIFHQLGDVSKYADKTCAAIQTQLKTLGSSMPVIYRPKPSWWANDDRDIDKTVPANTILSKPQEQFTRLLQQCYCLVTHGSNAAVEAIAYGVPIIITSPEGISPVYSLASHNLAQLKAPYWPDDSDRERILANLAHCQFNIHEITSGFAWQHLKMWLE